MKNPEPKRVCAIHDLSSYGRCALTVVIPALSAQGIQTVPLPTALMSTHTGGFDNIYIRDLTSDMRGMYMHWKELGVRFDAIYSGFVLHAGQGEIISEVIDTFREKDTLVLVDPVMGDHGELYSTCTPDIAKCMETLCKKADVITPNLTEACILTDTPYPVGCFSSERECRDFVFPILQKLTRLCPAVAMTGIEYTDSDVHYVACVSADANDEKDTVFCSQKKEGTSYPGTGELFASILLGQLLDGKKLCEAVEFSAGFVLDTIKLSETCITEKRTGTALEPALRMLR